MIERLTEYPGCLIRFVPDFPAHGEPILLLHGFPGASYLKNLDLAQSLYERKRRIVYILHYRGLGES